MKKKFHTHDCMSIKKIKDSNKETFTGSRDTLMSEGYEPCRVKVMNLAE